MEKPKEQTFIKPGLGETEFVKDLTEALLAADIPIDKINRPQFKNFLNKYTNEIIPSDTTIRLKGIPNAYNRIWEKIRSAIRNKYIWVAIDETVDYKRRCVVNVIVGILSQDKEESEKKYLLLSDMAERVNGGTIFQLFQTALRNVDQDFDFSRVILFLSDAAPYMVRAGDLIREIYPKVIDDTWVVHAVNLVCEKIRYIFHDPNDLIANVKKIFVKAPYRVRAFQEACPDIPLPPEPVLTRWGTWLEAVVYYDEHYNAIQSVVSKFDADDAVAIQAIPVKIFGTI